MHEALINYYSAAFIVMNINKSGTLYLNTEKTTFDLLGCWNLCQAKPVPWWDGTMCDKPRLRKGSWTQAANYRAGGAEGSTWITGEFLLSDYQGRKGNFLLNFLKLKLFPWSTGHMLLGALKFVFIVMTNNTPLTEVEIEAMEIDVKNETTHMLTWVMSLITWYS